MTPRSARRLGTAATALVIAAAGALPVATVVAATSPVAAGATSAGAAAAGCSSAEGVTAVVDFNELGGGATAGCDPNGGGRSAGQVFPAAGYRLEYAPRMQGFVCKVNGKPESGPCTENDAFWSLWWSDGKSGRWVFSNQGVGGLSVPDGGYVAFSWHQGSGGASPPDVSPRPHQQPDGGGSGGSGGSGGGSGGSGGSGGGAPAAPPPGTADAAPGAPAGSASASPGESASADAERKQRKKKRKQRRERAEADPTASEATPDADELAGPESVAADPADDDSGFPSWALVLLALLGLSAGAAVPIVRRIRAR